MINRRDDKVDFALAARRHPGAFDHPGDKSEFWAIKLFTSMTRLRKTEQSHDRQQQAQPRKIGAARRYHERSRSQK